MAGNSGCARAPGRGLGATVLAQHKKRGSQLPFPSYVTHPDQEIIRDVTEANGQMSQGTPWWPRLSLTPAGLLPSVCVSAHVFHKPQMRNLGKVSRCESSGRDSRLGPCQPMLVLEQMVPRDPNAGLFSRIVISKSRTRPNFLSLLVLRFLPVAVTGLLCIGNSDKQ